MLKPDSLVICAGDFTQACFQIRVKADLVQGVAWCGTKAVVLATNRKVVTLGKEASETREW
jgi:hypothetical protein